MQLSPPPAPAGRVGSCARLEFHTFQVFISRLFLLVAAVSLGSDPGSAASWQPDFGHRLYVAESWCPKLENRYKNVPAASSVLLGKGRDNAGKVVSTVSNAEKAGGNVTPSYYDHSPQPGRIGMAHHAAPWRPARSWHIGGLGSYFVNV